MDDQITVAQSLQEDGRTHPGKRALVTKDQSTQTDEDPYYHLKPRTTTTLQGTTSGETGSQG